jgi:hypothetical protein
MRPYLLAVATLLAAVPAHAAAPPGSPPSHWIGPSCNRPRVDATPATDVIRMRRGTVLWLRVEASPSYVVDDATLAVLDAHDVTVLARRAHDAPTADLRILLEGADAAALVSDRYTVAMTIRTRAAGYCAYRTGGASGMTGSTSFDWPG